MKDERQTAMFTRVALPLVIALTALFIGSCKRAEPNPVLEVAIGPYDTVAVTLGLGAVRIRSEAKPDRSGLTLALIDDRGTSVVEIEIPPERGTNGLRVLRITSNCPYEFDVVVKGFEEWRLEIDAGRLAGRTVPVGRHEVHVIEVSPETPSKEK